MKNSRRLIRVMRRMVALLGTDDILWAELRALVEDFGSECHEPGMATTEPDSIAPADTDATLEPTLSEPPVQQLGESGSLAMTAARFRLKAEGCRWVIARMSLRARGADHMTEIAPRDREILDRAKGLEGCRLWMCSASAPIPDDWSLYETLAGCFQALAAVLSIAASSHETIAADRRLLEELLRLGAEAQSSIREAVRRVGGPVDPDQIEAFWWVRNAAANAKIYIERYLRDEDPAEPTGWNSLVVRINGMAERVEQRAAADRKRRKLLQKLRYQLEQAVSGEDDRLWGAVARTLDEIIGEGVPPSNLEVRDLLLPHIEFIPKIDNPPKGFELTLRETRRFQDLLGDPPAEEASEGSLPIIEAAAELLRGEAVLLIGGEPRSDAKQSLERSLRLSELVWMPIKHGEHVSMFEQLVERRDVRIVLLAIRWSSHSCTDVRHLCRKYNKPLVRLPGGYGPNQVAAQIVNQCSWRLRQRRQQVS